MFQRQLSGAGDSLGRFYSGAESGTTKSLAGVQGGGPPTAGQNQTGPSRSHPLP